MLLIEFPLEKTVLSCQRGQMAPDVSLSVCGGQTAGYRASVFR